MKSLQDLQASLPMLKSFDFKRNEEGDLDLIDVERKPHAFIRDGMLFVSMEEGDGAGDYYGHYSMDGEEQDGIPYIADVLEAWATEHKGYWEWQDGGTIVFNQG